MDSGAINGTLGIQSAMADLINTTLVKATNVSQEQALALAKIDLQAQIDSQRIDSITAAAPLDGLGELLDVIA